MPDLAAALEHLEQGRWQDAHVIVQQDDSDLGAWLHGIVHVLEGDLDNARYWYAQAHRAWPGADALQRELGEARAALRGAA